MTKASIYIFILLCFSCSFIACEDEQPRLNRTHRKLIDSLVQEEKVKLRSVLDSLCDLRFEEEIDSKTDSIVQDRMDEIKRKIEADAKKN